jgi:hypothetical protein
MVTQLSNINVRMFWVILYAQTLLRIDDSSEHSPKKGLLLGTMSSSPPNATQKTSAPRDTSVTPKKTAGASAIV